MKNTRQAFPVFLVMLIVLVVILLLSSRFSSPSPAPALSPTPTVVVSPLPGSPTSTAPSLPPVSWDVSALPTVTPPAPGEPTLPPEALAMHAAPTATFTPITTPTPSATSIPTSTPIAVKGSDDVLMIEVPASKFIMGHTIEQAQASADVFKAEFGPSVSGLELDALPELTVYLDTFHIDQVEVSNTRYDNCVKSGICRSVSSLNVLPGDYPVVGVTWNDADTYCKWVGKRLPTEAEWEKAARGEDGRLYPWGDEWDASRVNTNVVNWNNLLPVDSLPQGASPYGVLNMAGNAFEWTNDWYDLYPSNPYQGPVSEEAKQNKILRGNTTRYYTIGKRSSSPPASTSNSLGFRCVRGAEPPPALASVVVSSSIPPMISPFTTSVDLSRMVYVPAGEFIMGVGAVVNEANPYIGSPAHVVYLDAFYIDRYEVTAPEYVAFLNELGSNRCYGHPCLREYQGQVTVQWVERVDGHYQVQLGFENRPIVGVSWHGAQAYCQWVNKRLPLEAEWEKAARGTDGRLYPWGNKWDSARAAAPGDSFQGGVYPFPIGSHTGDISPYGAYDMLGNAAEWAADWFSASYYSVSPYTNPQGPESGDEHVRRGVPGAYELTGIVLRDRGNYDLFNGFRCAQTP